MSKGSDFYKMGLVSRTRWALYFARATNKGGDQPVHPHSPISTFFAPSGKYSVHNVSIIVFVAEQARLNIVWSKTPKIAFLAMRPI